MGTEPTPQDAETARSSDVSPPEPATALPPANSPRLERISRLRHSGVLRDFTWPVGLTPFKRFNLVYGWNGTGKTTLSELLRALQDRRVPLAPQVVLRINGRDVRGEDFASVHLPIRVFNREFVRKNVFPDGGGGDLPLILLLGAESVEKQRHVTELRAHQETLVARLESAKAEAKTADDALDAHTVDRATAIREPLRAASSEYNNYHKGDYRKRAQKMLDANDSATYTLSSDARTRANAQQRGTPKDPIPLPIDALPAWGTLRDQAAQVLAQSVTSQALDVLRDDPVLAHWTKEGLELHRDRSSEQCLFCEQRLPVDRLSRLESHFSTAFRELEQRVTELGSVMSTQSRALERLALPKRAQLHDDLAADYQRALTALEQQLESFRQALTGLGKALENKSKRLFEALTLDVASPSLDPEPLAAVTTVIQKHNDACRAFEQRTIDARRALEADVVACAQPDFVRLTADKASKDGAVTSLGTELEGLLKAIADAEREVALHRRPAEELNEDLKAYLGHNELELAIKDSGYSVSRGGAPATGLSEGEQTAIALLYFLKCLKDQRFDLKRGVVVLDDPVSSLDANALFMAYGFIRSRLKDAGQIIILTHNFSFFRLVRNWFWFPHSQRQFVSLYMLEGYISEHARLARLVELPTLLRDFESEYHYLFSRVLEEARTLESGNLEAQYPIPNVARRLLETYLAFRQPNGKSLEAKIRAMAGDDAAKARVLRFLHVHSHGDAVPEPEHDLSLLGESRSVMQDLLKLLEGDDAAHYHAMVEACGQR